MKKNENEINEVSDEVSDEVSETTDVNTDIPQGEEEISLYYPDGDAEHMEQDDMDTEKVSQNVKKRNKIRKKNGKLSKSQIIIIAVVFVLYTAILLTVAWVAFYKPSSSGNNEVPFNTGNNDDPPLSYDPNTVVNNDYKANDGVYNILLVGHDAFANLADVTMIVNCNSNDHSISVMQLPRDTLVSLDVPTNKLNAAFATLNAKAYREGNENYIQKALDDYADLLEQSLCIKIHYSALLDLSGFRNIVDAVGGVDVYVPHDMYYEDPDQDLYIGIPSGMQHLDGVTAEGFVRFRSDFVQADLGRVNAQKIFLTAMFNKLKATVKSVDVPTLTNLISEAYRNVTTDLTTSDIMYFAKMLLNVNLEDINMTTLPGNVAGGYYVLNREATLDIINKYFNIYNKDISDTIFDRSKMFCITDMSDVCQVYYGSADIVLDKVYNGQNIDEDSIDIPAYN